MNLSSEIVAFANGNTDFYEAFADYHNHKAAEEWKQNLGSYDSTVSLTEKSKKVTSAFFAEIERLSNCPRTDMNKDAWMANPVVRWANMAIINAAVNVVLPAYVTATFAPFVDFRTVGYGDVLNLKVPPKTLYTVSRGGKGERTSFRQKKFAGNVVVSPIEHIVTTYVDMYRVLAGKDDLAEAVRSIVISIELDMNAEIVSALSTGLSAASYPAAFKESGAFDATKLVQLCQRVQAYNGMAKPVIMGTTAALMNVLPDSTKGYRMVIDGKEGAVSYVADFYGFDTFEIPQAPSGVAYGLKISDSSLYIVSPAVTKAIAGVMTTSLTNSNDFYDNADISQNFTMRKGYAFEFLGAAWAGIYTISA